MKVAEVLILTLLYYKKEIIGIQKLPYKLDTNIHGFKPAFKYLRENNFIIIQQYDRRFKYKLSTKGKKYISEIIDNL